MDFDIHISVVVAPGFVAMNITFRNTAGAIKYQAVTVRNGPNMSTFYSCRFEAYQDTLYTHSLRQFYRECDIYGTVDLIFGNAAVVFQIVTFTPDYQSVDSSIPSQHKVELIRFKI